MNENVDGPGSTNECKVFDLNRGNSKILRFAKYTVKFVGTMSSFIEWKMLLLLLWVWRHSSAPDVSALDAPVVQIRNRLLLFSSSSDDMMIPRKMTETKSKSAANRCARKALLEIQLAVSRHAKDKT